MNCVTPIGVIVSDKDKSYKFYKEVMEIERVQTLKKVFLNNFEGYILRLESPEIEVFETEAQIRDRPAFPIIKKVYNIQYKPINFGNVVSKLSKFGVNLDQSLNGKICFEDLNGLNWELKYCKK